MRGSFFRIGLRVLTSSPVTPGTGIINSRARCRVCISGHRKIKPCSHFCRESIRLMLNATFGGKSMKIRALNRKLAKQDPEGTFDSPLDIVDERLFTRGEKVATLNRWRQTALQTSVYMESRRVLELIDEAKSRLGM
jgi:hypothetical protein